MAEDLILDSKAQFRLPKEWHDEFTAHVKADGRDELDVLRELVRAFNAYCADGRRPTYPLQIASPGYIVNEGKVQDAGSIETALGEDADAHNAAQKKKFPYKQKGRESGAA